MKTYTQEEILKITNKLFTDNRENEGADDIDKIHMLPECMTEFWMY